MQTPKRPEPADLYSPSAAQTVCQLLILTSGGQGGILVLGTKQFCASSNCLSLGCASFVPVRIPWDSNPLKAEASRFIQPFGGTNSMPATHTHIWWAGRDSNPRRPKPADLQSAPFDHFGTYPPARYEYGMSTKPEVKTTEPVPANAGGTYPCLTVKLLSPLQPLRGVEPQTYSLPPASFCFAQCTGQAWSGGIYPVRADGQN